MEKVFAQMEQPTDFGGANNIGAYTNLLIKWGLPVLGSLAILMLVYAGYIYMTSQGNPDKLNAAKDIIVGVIVGILLLFTIGLFVQTVGGG